LVYGLEPVGGNEDPDPTIKYGDCNKDGFVDALDLFEMKKHLIDLRNTYYDYMDLNTDNYIDAIDLAILKQYLLGYIDKLPVN
jgi:endoglucanase